MPFLVPLLITVFTWFTRYLVLKAVAILGLSIISYAIIQTLFDKYVNAGLAQIGGISSDLSGLMAVSHLDQAISIVLGAYSVRAFIIAVKTAFSHMGL